MHSRGKPGGSRSRRALLHRLTRIFQTLAQHLAIHMPPGGLRLPHQIAVDMPWSPQAAGNHSNSQSAAPECEICGLIKGPLLALRRTQAEAAAIAVADAVEEAVAAAGPGFVNDFHMMPELAFWESAHFKPCKIFDGKIDDGDA